MEQGDDRRRDEKPAGEPEGLSQEARAWYRAEPYLRAVWNLTGGVGFGVVAGYLADRELETAPWLLVTGSMLGMGLGMYGFIKAVSAAEKARRGSGKS